MRSALILAFWIAYTESHRNEFGADSQVNVDLAEQLKKQLVVLQDVESKSAEYTTAVVNSIFIVTASVLSKLLTGPLDEGISDLSIGLWEVFDAVFGQKFEENAQYGEIAGMWVTSFGSVYDQSGNARDMIASFKTGDASKGMVGLATLVNLVAETQFNASSPELTPQVSRYLSTVQVALTSTANAFTADDGERLVAAAGGGNDGFKQIVDEWLPGGMEEEGLYEIIADGLDLTSRDLVNMAYELTEQMDTEIHDQQVGGVIPEISHRPYHVALQAPKPAPAPFRNTSPRLLR